MQDFIRIGGEVVSSPLNENFRRLLNAISIANVNLVFPEENGIVNTIADMYAIPNPQSAQTCYVISSGELYRYDKSGDGRWIKIADFGQTFRQGFLNSGLVVAENPILRSGVNKIKTPNMLLYYKNKPGDDRYLKGMYLVEEKELDTTAYTQPGVYSIYASMVDRVEPLLFIRAGMPLEDSVGIIYLGSFLVDTTHDIMEDFVFTIPDMAYTGDRGMFFVEGGQASGCNLVGAETSDNKVNRNGGYYYDEGINFPMGETSNYPVDTDNGSNYNLKYYQGEYPVDKIYYMQPVDGLNKEITVSSGIIKNKYYDLNTNTLKDVSPDHYTIQQHFLTPNGQDIILYGTQEFNSIFDAVSNVNTVYGTNLDFPYIEATRIVIGNVEHFTTQDSTVCRFFTLGRLAQVGTISPEFADNQFTIYSGDTTDTTPAAIKISLDELEAEDYDIENLGYYKLRVLPYGTTRQLFSLAQKYITDSYSEDVVQTQQDNRVSSGPGYELADSRDLQDAINRIEDIEAEIWANYDEAKQRYEQSVRRRLFNAEERLDNHDTTLADHESRITSNEQNKVNKSTTINGYTLGNTTSKGEAKSIALVTGDIAEGQGNGQRPNLWYTDARVSANADVAVAKTHADTTSASDNATGHVKVNPHNLSTDDINYLMDTTKVFVTPQEERRIRDDRLPENTIQALADLDAKNMDNIPVTVLGGRRDRPTGTRTKLGDFKNLEFYEDGVHLDASADGETLTIEVQGQMDESVVMTKNRYATLEAEFPERFGGYVDKAVNADYAYAVDGIEEAGANQYYGTDNKGDVGVYDLPVYVSTVDQSSFASLDQIIFVPVDNSITLQHLVPSLRDKINNNYHSVYDDGSLESTNINALNFGDNLSVSINGNVATINATGAGEQAVHNFVNLNDVDVTYTNNAGKMVVVNEDETGLALAKAPSLREFMLRSVYVDPVDVTKIKKAVHSDQSDLAAVATNASAVNDKVVDDSLDTNAVLWTASKIKANTSTQISEEGVNTYSGTTIPANSLGKNGDLYILVEE